MTFLKYVALGATALGAIQACSAQIKFPLRSGQWEATTSFTGTQNQPLTVAYCLNDELWQKALIQNSYCSVQQLRITSSGASYMVDCTIKAFQMKGKVDMTFDGMQHMTAKAQFDITMDGKTTTSATVADYRWKGATCSPDDANLRPKKAD
ncbi:MAG: DUF3617 family protein [Terracidiphilus sp.]